MVATAITKTNQSRRGRRVRSQQKTRTVDPMSTGARLCSAPINPPEVANQLKQTRWFAAELALSAAGSVTATVSSFCTAVGSSLLPTTARLRILKVRVYGINIFSTSTTASQNVLTVVDELPNNDALLARDVGVPGQSRPCVCYAPTLMDQLTYYSPSSTQNIFQATDGSVTAAGASCTVYLLLEVRYQ